MATQVSPEELAKMSRDELETHVTGLPPLHTILDSLRAAQEKVKRVHITDPHYNDGLADAEVDAERYHELYAPPKIPVRYWLVVRRHLMPVLQPYRYRLASWLKQQSFRLGRLAERVQHAW
jgi:hypothetical protein